jgi:hypothetical protein
MTTASVCLPTRRLRPSQSFGVTAAWPLRWHISPLK